MDRDIKKITKLAEESGALGERERILAGLYKADLPLGVWPLIRSIVLNKKEKETPKINNK